MYDDELKRVSKLITRRNARGKLKGKEVYMFGVSDNTRQIIQILRGIGVEPQNIIDNDPSKQGSHCSMLKVIALQDIENPEADNKLYIIYSAYWREMLSQLADYGILRSNIWRLNPKPGTIFGLLKNAYGGKWHYKKLVKKYGNIPIFLCPYTGTGDIYLIGTFWNEYIKRNHITEYVFVVITEACKKVALLFGIKNIVLVKKKWYASRLIDYYLYDRANGKIKILNDCWPQVHTNQVEWFRGYRGLYFTGLFRRFVFELPDGVKPAHPVFRDESERIGYIFSRYDLVYGKTVVLSPYSRTLLDLSVTFWEKLASELSYRGYRVITNSGGTTEPAIKGTEGVFFPLDIAPQFIEKAGAFIGVRSGFCDVISGAKATKVILYDAENRFYMGSAFEYFSLKGMELCDDAVEYEFDHENVEKVLEKVLTIFKEV